MVFRTSQYTNGNAQHKGTPTIKNTLKEQTEGSWVVAGLGRAQSGAKPRIKEEAHPKTYPWSGGYTPARSNRNAGRDPTAEAMAPIQSA